MILSGFPPNVLAAYMNYQENADIYFSFSGHIGKPHKHQCGIPQGCPFSMLFIALLLRPWHILLASLSRIPRALADDLLILAAGPHALTFFERAFNASCNFLHDMGNRIAGQKCKISQHMRPSGLGLQRKFGCHGSDRSRQSTRCGTWVRQSIQCSRLTPNCQDRDFIKPVVLSKRSAICPTRSK